MSKISVSYYDHDNNEAIVSLCVTPSTKISTLMAKIKPALQHRVRQSVPYKALLQLKSDGTWLNENLTVGDYPIKNGSEIFACPVLCDDEAPTEALEQAMKKVRISPKRFAAPSPTIQKEPTAPFDDTETETYDKPCQRCHTLEYLYEQVMRERDMLKVENDSLKKQLRECRRSM